MSAEKAIQTLHDATDEKNTMRKQASILRSALFVGFGSIMFSTNTLAAIESESGFIFNSFSFLLWGAFVMWMCAGFTMLESGSVRTKNASVICMKNIGLYSIAGLAFYVIGYNLMYVDVGSIVGTFKLFYQSSVAEIALVGGDENSMADVLELPYSTMSDWFFQMVFVATTASIISGALAERIKLWSFFLFTIVLTAVIYPLVGAWTWGGGWLSQLGFIDFAGSTIVHSTGGWAALAGALILGPRSHKYRKDGTVKYIPPSNIPVVTLGIFILWLGWFGFNGGSVLALDSASAVISMSIVLVNTNIAAAAGVMVALIVSRPILGNVNLFAVLNGAIGGLVAITAGPEFVDHQWAILIGGIGGLVSTLGLKVLDMLKIDDVVGAIPAHLFAGVWGTMAVCIANGGSFTVQLVGVLAIGAFVFCSSWLVWMLLDKIMKLRVSAKVEELGQDLTELGLEAYPEFVIMQDSEDENEFIPIKNRRD